LYSVASVGRVPETTRKREILPVKGSDRVLKTRTARGPAGSAVSWIASPPRVRAGKGGASTGEGRIETMLSSSAEEPIP
jgi:hypothetical protein